MYSKEIQVMKKLACEAAQLILSVYHSDFSVTEKDRQRGPVTEADLASDRVIVSGLKEAFPEDAIVSEESGGNEQRQQRKRLWLVDPLDGTKEFVKRNGEFSIHIGLAVEGVPVLGLVYVPVTCECGYGGKGMGSYYEDAGGKVKQLFCSGRPNKSKILIGSRSHRGKVYEKVKKILDPEDERSMGSVGCKALKICLGEADLLFYANAEINEWDVCAPMALVEGAGGSVTGLLGERLIFNSPPLKMEKGVLISNGVGHTELTEELKKYFL